MAVTHKILQVFPDGAVEAQIVMAGEVMVKPPFFVRTIGRNSERQREQIYKRGLNARSGRRVVWRRSYRHGEALLSPLVCANRRECNQTALKEFPKKGSSGEIF